MRPRILIVLAVLDAMAALLLAGGYALAGAAAAQPARISHVRAVLKLHHPQVAYPSQCSFGINIADINETYGAYGVGAQNNGDAGDLGTEVFAPGWDVCTYQHPDGSWNLYLYNGNELASHDSCTGGTGAIVVKTAGSAGTRWTLQGHGPNSYQWYNDRCAAYLAGTNRDQPLALCDNSGGTYDCSNGYFRTMTLNYGT